LPKTPKLPIINGFFSDVRESLSFRQQDNEYATYLNPFSATPLVLVTTESLG
jgi:hypothetical protein